MSLASDAPGGSGFDPSGYTGTMIFSSVLDAPFAVAVPPTPLPDLVVAHRRSPLAVEMDLDPAWLDQEAFRRVLAGLDPLPGAEARASVYAGHQFGTFVPQLGDGRAHLIGRHQHRDGRAWEWQLKGAGKTPYSRFADGRAVLRSSLREYVASEALHALGVPTTRALALGVSREPVRRETLERAAVVLRVAPSFLRFGHFEYWAYRDAPERVKALAEHVITAHFPECVGDPVGWLREVLRRTANLMAQWQTLGFCHGVMNTDNMSILGLTLDYGPYGFLDAFNPRHICNHSDHSGRYAWDQQPAIGQWNCARLLEACLCLLAPQTEAAIEIAQDLLASYAEAYSVAAHQRWAAKFGLQTREADDAPLMQDFLRLLQRGQHDFTLCFRHLPRLPQLRELILDQAGLEAWWQRYTDRLDREGGLTSLRTRAMDAVNPLYVPRNHLLQMTIEAAEGDDFAPLDRLVRTLDQPYTAQAGADDLAALPPDWAAAISISCSS